MKLLFLLALLPAAIMARYCYPPAFSTQVSNLVTMTNFQLSVDFNRKMISMRSKDYSILINMATKTAKTQVYYTPKGGKCSTFRLSSKSFLEWDRCLDRRNKVEDLTEHLLGVNGAHDLHMTRFASTTRSGMKSNLLVRRMGNGWYLPAVKRTQYKSRVNVYLFSNHSTRVNPVFFRRPSRCSGITRSQLAKFRRDISSQ